MHIEMSAAARRNKPLSVMRNRGLFRFALEFPVKWPIVYLKTDFNVSSEAATMRSNASGRNLDQLDVVVS